jgi:hypothetical protein
MSDSSNSRHDQNLTTQKLFEHQIIYRFDNPCIKQNPFVGSFILCLHGFGLVKIVGIDPRVTKVGDLVVKIHHRRFDTQSQIWIKIIDGTREYISIAQF